MKSYYSNDYRGNCEDVSSEVNPENKYKGKSH